MQLDFIENFSFVNSPASIVHEFLIIGTLDGSEKDS